MKMETIYLPFGQPVADAYIERKDSRLQELFGYHAAEPEHWQQRLLRLRGTALERADSRLVAQALRAFQEPFGLSDRAGTHLEQLAAGAPVIAGGQQAVLWSGPMMILHKAATIVQAAEWASKRLGEPVVPVFWIAGEDHDWDEASQINVPALTEGAGLGKLAIGRTGTGRTSVSRTGVTAEVLEQALRELEQALPDSEHKTGLIEELRSAASRSGTLTELFAIMLNRLFGDRGLLLADADHHQLRKLESPMFSKLIQHNEELEHAYGSASRRLAELGYSAQAELAEGGANLFLFHDTAGEARAEERLLLSRKDGQFQDRKAKCR